jgi:hypothetical protein
MRLKLALAAICLLAGTTSTLLAVDALSWRNSMRSDDLRFAAFPAKRDLWRPRQLFPFGTAKAALDVDDDVAYRRAVQAFALARPRDERYSDTDLLGRRGQAQELLTRIVDGRQDEPRRASAENLIGVLGFANAAVDPEGASSYLTSAVEHFQRAIALDPQSADAKYNLELALDRLAAVKPRSGTNSSSNTRGGAGSGAGAGREGSGY